VSVPAAVVAEIRAAKSIVVATHSPMDGDGLGCGLALQRALRATGRTCEFLTEAAVPQAYRWLPGWDGIVVLRRDEPPPACDLLLGLDAGQVERLGRACSERAPSTRVVNIDHHVSNSGYGDAAWVDAAAAATGEMVFALVNEMGFEIDPVSAQCLLVSIVTDTGRFCYSSTTARTLETAAALVRLGAEPDEIQRHLYGSVPVGIHRLRARAIEEMRLLADGRLALLAVDARFGSDLGAGPEEVKDLIDILISVEGVSVAALVRGLEDGGAKVSLRSKSDRANVAEFARAHGGGGHVRASGFTAAEPPDEVAGAIAKALEELAVVASG